jgi:maleylpyruvate isomerase
VHEQGREGLVTGRTHADSLKWAEHGTGLFVTHVALLDDESMSAPSRLPGWTRKHLVAHIAANSDALGNLVHWARTGDARRCIPRPTSAMPISSRVRN